MTSDDFPAADSPPIRTYPQNLREMLGPALGFGLLVFALLPAGVAVFNDDFGYLRSVVETVRHGRPSTDDWLAPWAASFSLLAALLYESTGSFHFATQGLLAILAALSFWAACALFVARGNSPRRSIVLTGLLLTFPTLIWKSVEFTSVALYLPCLLLALRAAENKAWGRFGLWWGVAIAARQSAVVWAVFPALEIILHFRNSPGTRRPVWAPVLSLGTGLAFFGALTQGMNKTHAQAVVTDHLLDRLAWPAVFATAALGLLVYLWAAGLQGFLATHRGPRGNRWFTRTLPVAAVLLLPVVVRLGWVSFEHSLLSGPIGVTYGGLVVLLGAAGWWSGGIRLRPEPAIAALGSVGLLCLRPEIWDYYLLEVAVLGFFGTAAAPANAPPNPAVFSGGIRSAALGVLAAFHVLFVLDLKCTLDRAYALCSLAETALRKNLLEPTELSFAPFGFTGWHLNRHFVAHDGATSAQLDGFNGYTIPGAVEVGQGYSRALHLLPRFRHEPPGDRHNLILNGRYRFAWFFHAEFFLLRFKTGKDAPPALLLPADQYRAERFPLNDSEWRTLIETADPVHRR